MSGLLRLGTVVFVRYVGDTERWRSPVEEDVDPLSMDGHAAAGHVEHLAGMRDRAHEQATLTRRRRGPLGGISSIVREERGRACGGRREDRLRAGVGAAAPGLSGEFANRVGASTWTGQASTPDRVSSRLEHDRRVRPASRVVARRVRGELVVVPMPSFDTIVLNDFGAAVWEAVGDGASIADVCAQLAAGDPRVSEDVREFVRTLVDEGLLCVDESDV